LRPVAVAYGGPLAGDGASPASGDGAAIVSSGRESPGGVSRSGSDGSSRTADMVVRVWSLSRSLCVNYRTQVDPKATLNSGAFRCPHPVFYAILNPFPASLTHRPRLCSLESVFCTKPCHRACSDQLATGVESSADERLARAPHLSVIKLATGCFTRRGIV
jgi:hypothetical protein